LVLDGAATPELLLSYQAERLPQVRTVVEASMRVGRYICTLDPEAAKRRDVEMRAVAMRTAPGYVDIIPPLSAGVLAPIGAEMSPTGSRFIQPPVLDASGRRMLLDDATGGGFVLLSRSLPDLTGELRGTPFDGALGLKKFTIVEAGDHRRFAREGTLIDCSGELMKWFDYYRCGGVLLRPDAYVFGAFSTVEEGVAILRSLRQQICPDEASRQATSGVA
jgi:3-(3-hydroxy-phenyl)propionate hydroxylase